MKVIIGVILSFFLMISCSRVEPDGCEVFYHMYYVDKNSNECLSDISQIQEYYQTDSIKIISKNNGYTNEYGQFGDFNQDSCYFIVADISIPIISFSIGNIKGKNGYNNNRIDKQ